MQDQIEGKIYWADHDPANEKLTLLVNDGIGDGKFCQVFRTDKSGHERPVYADVKRLVDQFLAEKEDNDRPDMPVKLLVTHERNESFRTHKCTECGNKDRIKTVYTNFTINKVISSG